jgi:hypothetical protein
MNIQPGDAIYARTHNIYGFMIRIAQALRWWKGRDWNHVAIVDHIDADGQIWVNQMAKRCEQVKIEDVAPGGKLKWVPMPEGLDRERVLAWSRKRLGIHYGYLTIASIAFNLLLPERISIDIHIENTLICSAYVARAWEHGGFDCPVNPMNITPAELDLIQNGGGIVIQ